MDPEVANITRVVADTVFGILKPALWGFFLIMGIIFCGLLWFFRESIKTRILGTRKREREPMTANVQERSEFLDKYLDLVRENHREMVETRVSLQKIADSLASLKEIEGEEKERQNIIISKLENMESRRARGG